MCRNLASRIRAIENAKRTTPHIIEVYDTGGDGMDLTSIIEVIHETTARIMDVDRYGGLSKFKEVPIYDPDELDNRRVARLIGTDPRFIRLKDNMIA